MVLKTESLLSLDSASMGRAKSVEDIILYSLLNVLECGLHVTLNATKWQNWNFVHSQVTSVKAHEQSWLVMLHLFGSALY